MDATSYRRRPYDKRTRQEAEDAAEGKLIDGSRYTGLDPESEALTQLCDSVLNSEHALSQGLMDIANHLFRLLQRVAGGGPNVDGRDLALSLQFLNEAQRVLSKLYWMHFQVLEDSHGLSQASRAVAPYGGGDGCYETQNSFYKRAQRKLSSLNLSEERLLLKLVRPGETIDAESLDREAGAGTIETWRVDGRPVPRIVDDEPWQFFGDED